MVQFNIADVFEAVTAAVPERAALTYAGENLTYARLDREANRVARLFAGAGIAAGEHVSLFLAELEYILVSTARTFPTRADGTRLAVLGDMGRVESDGTIVFLGRGSQCIDTGGEKVFAEEVEAALRAHPSIADALVVPVPDERMGQRVSAVIETYPGVAQPTLEDIQQHCRKTLAGYKVPRSMVRVDKVRRTPAGKADYRWATAVASAYGSTGYAR